MKKRFLPFPLAAFLLPIFLCCCVETVVIGSVATGAITTREKSFVDTKNDNRIAFKLGLEFLKNGLKNPGNSVDITVDEGRVLLTGILRNPQNAKLAQELAWKVEGVNEVIDEIQPYFDETIRSKDLKIAIQDYLITAEIEARLLLNRDVRSLNYHVSTVNKITYLFGVSQNKKEMDLAIAIASVVRGVDKVVNHLILVDDSRRI